MRFLGVLCVVVWVGLALEWMRQRDVAMDGYEEAASQRDRALNGWEKATAQVKELRVLCERAVTAADGWKSNYFAVVDEAAATEELLKRVTVAGEIWRSNYEACVETNRIEVHVLVPREAARGIEEAAEAEAAAARKGGVL
jgi:hypothetical protein